MRPAASFIGAVLAAALLPAAVLAKSEEAAPGIVVATNPAMVALKLRDMGYRAKLRQGESRPYIDSGTSGYFFSISFFGCKRDIDCTGLLLTSTFDLDAGFSLKEINAWNYDRLVGRAYVDDACDPGVDHFVLAEAEMSGDTFERLLDDWDYALSDFADFIGYNDDTPRAVVMDCGQDGDAI